MSWIELDDRILDHPKFIRAVKEAGPGVVFLWLGVRAYVAQNLTDGHVPADMLDEVRGPKGRERANGFKVLRAVRLLHNADERRACEACKSANFELGDGLWMHDYLSWSSSRSQVEDRRRSARERKAKSRDPAGEVRGESRRDSERDERRDSAGSSVGVTDPRARVSSASPLPTSPSPTDEEGARGAPDLGRSVDPLMNPEETVMPSGLRERALEPGNAVDHLTKVCKVPREVIVAELEAFCRYREAGAGMGDKRSYWLKHFRQQVLNRNDKGLLKPAGLVEHEANAEAKPPRKVKTLAEMEQEALDARS